MSIALTELQIQLAAQDLSFKLRLTAEPGRAWRYNLSEVRKDPDSYHSRAAYGRVIAPDYQVAT